ATVSSQYTTPTGTVTFKDGDAVLGSGDLASGVATLTVRSLRKGAHAITAKYAAAADFAASTGILAGGEVVENTPPVAGSGTALSFGPSAATSAQVTVSGGLLDLASGTVELWARTGWTDPGDLT